MCGKLCKHPNLTAAQIAGISSLKEEPYLPTVTRESLLAKHPGLRDYGQQKQ